MGEPSLAEILGGMDIYLVDQIVKGRITPRMTVLDAGCGGGRNLIYLARAGATVYGVDRSDDALSRAFHSLRAVRPDLSRERFLCESIEDLSFADGTFHAVICSAVLHFAEDREHFDRMLAALWRVLAPGGFLFTRLASSIGIEDLIEPAGPGRFALPDGTRRYLVDEATLVGHTERLGGRLTDPLKTTVVQGLRSMTTWCLEKAPERGVGP